MKTAMTKKSVKLENAGRSTHRFKDNPEELRFAVAWDKLCRHNKQLEYMVGDGCRQGNPSARDVEIAATIIQWLGSPVGQHFLQDLGYEKK
jgi:hypothetical protein